MDVNEQIKNRFYSFIADGIEKFPKPKKTPNINHVNTNELIQKIAHCKLCSLSQSRKKVVVSPHISSKKFFILSEFPYSEEENSNSNIIFSEKSPSGLILKLLEKLKITSQCHFSFALKCVPEKGIPHNSFSQCVQHNLKIELTSVNPEHIFCFGQRALNALAQLSPSINANLATENSSLLKFQVHEQDKPIDIYFLSSSSDLENFPHWRTQVWTFLKHFLS